MIHLTQLRRLRFYANDIYGLQKKQTQILLEHRLDILREQQWILIRPNGIFRNGRKPILCKRMEIYSIQGLFMSTRKKCKNGMLRGREKLFLFSVSVCLKINLSVKIFVNNTIWKINLFFRHCTLRYCTRFLL